MNGYVYGEKEPTEYCPYCGLICSADFVDIGVGFQQCGPFHCERCGASEIGSYDSDRVLSPDEKKTGWYGPNSETGSTANVIGGKIVSYKRMKQVYKREFTGNPLWENKEYVEDWWDKIRS